MVLSGNCFRNANVYQNIIIIIIVLLTAVRLALAACGT